MPLGIRISNLLTIAVRALYRGKLATTDSLPINHRNSHFAPGPLPLTLLCCLTAIAPSARGQVEIPKPGIINTVAGNGTQYPLNNGGPATDAGISGPEDVVLDSAGNIYIADFGNSVIRKVTASTGIITTVAGNGYTGDECESGPATSVALGGNPAIALDKNGNLYILQNFVWCISAVNMGTTATTIAGVVIQPGYMATIIGNGTESGTCYNGPALDAGMWGPQDLAVDNSGNIYYENDYTNLCKVNGSTGIESLVSTEFGGNVRSDQSGNLFEPGGSEVLVMNTGSSAIKIAGVTIQPGAVGVVAGNGTEGVSGDGGPATSAEINAYAIAVDAADNFYIIDYSDNIVRKVTNETGIIETIAGNGSQGFSGDGGEAIAAKFYSPTAAAVDASGNLYIADLQNNRIRAIGANTFSNLNAVKLYGGWQNPPCSNANPYGSQCAGGNGTPTSTSQTNGISSPSLDGKSMKISLTYPSGTQGSGSVTTSGTTVTWASGTQFSTNWIYLRMTINGTNYTIQSVTSGTQLTLSTSAGTHTTAVTYTVHLPQGETTNVLWPYKVGAQDGLTHMVGTFSVYMPSLSNIQALEYDQFQFDAGQRYMYGSQCVFGSGGKWWIWNQCANSNGGEWVVTTISCSLTAAAWHTLQWQTHRVPGDTSCTGGNPCMYYDALVIDGTTYSGSSYGLTPQCSAPNSEPDNAGIQFQIDESYLGGTATEYLDLVSLMMY